jgi:site-specific DNA-methyltransferase (adenine-specific)
MNLDIYNIDNMQFETDEKFDLIFADYIYESLNFNWAEKYWNNLKDGAVLVAMTDYHSAAEYKVFVQYLPDANFVNWLIWKNEFGNFRKDRFRQCHDDIIIFSKGKNFNFDADKVQVPKATAKSKGLNPSGRETKLATSVITDICLTTVAHERVKKSDGHLVRWQKPQSLLQRIISPFVKEGDYILDPFMGSGSLGLWCKNNGMNYVGIENDPEVFELAKKNIGV